MQEATGTNVKVEAKKFKAFVNIDGKSTQEGTPSPSIPSDIHSVADDVNLWQLSSSYTTNSGSEYVIRDTVIPTIPAGTYTLSLKKSVNSNLFFNFKDGSNQETTIFLDGVENVTMTFTNDIVKVAIYIYGNQACTISDIKINKGTTATPYSPYGKGTVTIQRRGINYWSLNSSYTTATGSEYVLSNTAITKIPIGTYTLSLNKSINAKVVFTFKSASNETFTATLDNTEQTVVTFWEDAVTASIYIYGNEECTISNIQIEFGLRKTHYEPHITPHDYIIETDPLRSLPNGVKDTKEEDGIHKKIGIQTGTLSQTTTITLSDAKLNGAYMCNIKESGILNGQTIELGAGDYEIIYELAEEVIEPFTTEQLDTLASIETGQGTNKFTTTDDLEPMLTLIYKPVNEDYYYETDILETRDYNSIVSDINKYTNKLNINMQLPYKINGNFLYSEDADKIDYILKLISDLIYLEYERKYFYNLSMLNFEVVNKWKEQIDLIDEKLEYISANTYKYSNYTSNTYEDLENKTYMEVMFGEEE